jgi:hypothetical protein
VIFHAESKCTWRSKCGRYQIVHTIAGFGLEVWLCRVEGQEGDPYPALSLDRAMDWCAKHDYTPEVDFPTHCDMQSGGAK